MPDQTSRPTKFPWAFFALAFGFSWLWWLPAVLSSRGLVALPWPNQAFVILGAHGPLVAALSLTYRSGGPAAVRRLLRAGFNLRLALRWWVILLGLPLALSGLAVWLNWALSGYQADMSLWRQPLLILPTYLVMFFVGGSLQEEFGWRGYALPALLARWRPLVASLVLGLIWGGWHLPLFWITGVSQAYMPLGVFLILTLALSQLFTWAYLGTRANLFSALLLHTAVNAALSLFPPIELKPGGNQVAFTYLALAYAVVAGLLALRERPWPAAEAPPRPSATPTRG